MATTRQCFFIALSLIVLAMISGCAETALSNAKKTYKYWTGKNAPADIELLNGQYKELVSWSKEYIMYLKFKATKEWWDNFLKQDPILEDKNNWAAPSDAPAWFKPSVNSARYGFESRIDQGSRYFYDSITGIAYIYEIQL